MVVPVTRLTIHCVQNYNTKVVRSATLTIVLEQRFKEGMKRKSVNQPGHAEIECYFDSVKTTAESADPLSY